MESQFIYKLMEINMLQKIEPMQPGVLYLNIRTVKIIGALTALGLLTLFGLQVKHEQVAAQKPVDMESFSTKFIN